MAKFCGIADRYPTVGVTLTATMLRFGGSIESGGNFSQSECSPLAATGGNEIHIGFCLTDSVLKRFFNCSKAFNEAISIHFVISLNNSR